MQKKIPQRQCMGCRERRAKRELIRVVRSPEGNVNLDFGGKAPGRGAYLCKNAQCMEKALRQRQLERAFEAPIGDEVKQQLTRELEALK